MHTVIVCNSLYGNTQQIADAIADEMQAAGPVDMINVHPEAAELKLPEKIDLLLVGGPTQVHGIAKTLKESLAGLPGQALDGVAAAAFDTRLRGWAVFTGAASSGIARRLKQHGAHMLVPPQSFLVMGGEGPLVDGEVERARDWAHAILVAVGQSTPSRVAAV